MGIKKYNYITGGIEDTNSIYTSYYSDAWYNNEEYKIPPYIKYNGSLYWKIEGTDYYNNYEGVLIPMRVVVDMLDCGKAVAEDININRVGKKVIFQEDWWHNTGALMRILGGKNNDEIAMIKETNARINTDGFKVHSTADSSNDIVGLMNEFATGKLKRKKEKVEMKRNVIVKKDFRGLKAGTEFAYDPNLGMWVFENQEEEIGDNSYKSSHSKVHFSDTYVKSKPEYFQVPDYFDKEKVEKEQKIKNLEDLVEKTLKEINELRTTTNDEPCGSCDECCESEG